MTEDEKRVLWVKMKSMFDRWDMTEDERLKFIESAKADIEGARAVVEYDAAHPYIAEMTK